ncbi:hypothetical protein, partial [Streptomyces sp. NPDC056817]
MGEFIYEPQVDDLPVAVIEFGDHRVWGDVIAPASDSSAEARRITTPPDRGGERGFTVKAAPPGKAAVSPFAQVSARTCHKGSQLPKLRARVRFSSPAPERNPRSVTFSQRWSFPDSVEGEGGAGDVADPAGAEGD